MEHNTIEEWNVLQKKILNLGAYMIHKLWNENDIYLFIFISSSGSVESYTHANCSFEEFTNLEYYSGMEDSGYYSTTI